MYPGPAYAIETYDDCICPWCIADDTARAKLNVTFTCVCDIGIGTWEKVSKTVIEEVAYRTPGFSGQEQSSWWTHCNDAAQFLGQIGSEELRVLGPDTLKRIREDTGVDDAECWEEILDAVGKGQVYRA